MKKICLTFISVVCSQLILAQTHFFIGPVAKAEINAYEHTASDGAVEKAFQSKPGSGFGLLLGQTFGIRFFGDVSFLASKSTYTVNQTVGTSVFQSAELHFFQTNAHLNFWLSQSHAFRFYSFAGIQHLYRRWGIESYVQSVVPNSRWQNQRLMLQAGLGTEVGLGENWNLRFFGGLRYNPKQTLIYDNTLSQIFGGVALLYSWQKVQKSATYKCPKF